MGGGRRDAAGGDSATFSSSSSLGHQSRAREAVPSEAGCYVRQLADEIEIERRDSARRADHWRQDHSADRFRNGPQSMGMGHSGFRGCLRQMRGSCHGRHKANQREELLSVFFAHRVTQTLDVGPRDTPPWRQLYITEKWR